MTRNHLLEIARKSCGSTTRRDYCSKCYENSRRFYQTGLVPVGSGSLAFLGSLGPALIAQLLSGCPQYAPTPVYHPQYSPLTHTYYQDGSGIMTGGASATGAMSGDPDSGGAPAISYESDSPFKGRDSDSVMGGQQDDIKKPKQPKNMEFKNRKWYEKVNPWSVCHSSTGPSKSRKFEDCVKAVKSKNKKS